MRHLTPGAATSRGMTLIELIIGLAVAAMLVMVGAPYFGDYITNSRLRESGHTLFAEAMFAQGEAIKRNVSMRVVVTGSKVETRDMTVGSTGTLVREVSFAEPVAAVANASFDFSSDGRPSPFGTNVAVNLGISGLSCSGDNVRCPGLRIDAGGAVRICGNYLSGCP